MGEHQGRTPPVKKGERYTLEVESIASKGDGVAHVTGFVVFVKQPCEVGKRYEVEITWVGQKCASGDVISEAV